MILEIALCHARRGAKFLYDERGVPAFRIDEKTDLLGILIPLSIYYSTERIESLTTYELCDGKIWDKEMLEVINRLDHIQACHPEERWVERIEALMVDYQNS